MELRQLNYFLAAAQTQNFRRAAELCLVAQSALSRQIATLEAELGVLLFQRVERRVILTPAGEEFAAYARGALEQLQKGQEAMVELEAGERGTVVVGCVEALAITYLPGLFAAFNRQHPHISLKIKVAGADDLMRLVEQGGLDFGLIFDPPPSSQLVTVREIIRQPIQLVTAPNYQLQQPDEPLLLENLRHEPLASLGEGFGLRRIMETIYRQRGFAFQPIVEIDSIEALKEFVKQGIGITFMATALLRPAQIGTELAVRPVADLQQEFIFALVQRRIGTLSRAARSLAEAIVRSID